MKNLELWIEQPSSVINIDLLKKTHNPGWFIAYSGRTTKRGLIHMAELLRAYYKNARIFTAPRKGIGRMIWKA